MTRKKQSLKVMISGANQGVVPLIRGQGVVLSGKGQQMSVRFTERRLADANQRSSVQGRQINAAQIAQPLRRRWGR